MAPYKSYRLLLSTPSKMLLKRWDARCGSNSMRHILGRLRKILRRVEAAGVTVLALTVDKHDGPAIAKLSAQPSNDLRVCLNCP